MSHAGNSYRAALSLAFSPLVNTNILLESLDDPNENRQSAMKFIRSGRCLTMLGALGAILCPVWFDSVLYVLIVNFSCDIIYVQMDG
jgi:hypothetical protein